MRSFHLRMIATALLLPVALAHARSLTLEDACEPNAPQDLPSRASFEPLKLWKAAVLAGDAAALSAMYSANPAVRVATLDGNLVTPAEEVEFWTSPKKSGLTSAALEVVQFESLRPDVVRVVFYMELGLSPKSGPQKLYASVSQVWVKQVERWRIVESRRTGLTRLKQPVSTSANLYPADADAEAEIKAALSKSASEHKRVLIVFGANWCYDHEALRGARGERDSGPGGPGEQREAVIQPEEWSI